MAATVLILGVTGDIKYPAICIPRYLSAENFQAVQKAEKALSLRPDCKKIGEETVIEGNRAGDTFSIYTCCTSI